MIGEEEGRKSGREEGGRLMMRERERERERKKKILWVKVAIEADVSWSF